MNYQKVYTELMTSRQSMLRKKYCNEYFEVHHIIPRSLGGNNEKDNRVLLTGKEHFLAHLLLVRIHTGKIRGQMIAALWKMCTDKHKNRKLNITASQYASARKALAESVSLRFKGVSKSLEMREKLKNISAEARSKAAIKAANTRIKNGNHRTSESTKEKIRTARKLQKINGSLISTAQIAKGSNKKTAEQIQKMREDPRHKKQVSQFTQAGVWVKDFESMMEAAKFIGVTLCCISDCVHGTQKTSKGFVFTLKSAG